MPGVKNRSAGSLWAVTCFYNPMGNEHRLVNYHTFRQRLNAPLVTVELAYNEEFQLNESDVEILIQLHAKDVLWQTERLFNLAIQAVPRDCQKIAWIDCDIVFQRDDWASATSQLLDRFALVQLYEKLYDLRRHASFAQVNLEHADWAAVSVVSALAAGKSAPDVLRLDVSSATGRSRAVSGGAWAARREVIDEHGLYDACILAGNDRARACAAMGHFDAAIENWLMNARQAEHYMAWAKPFFNTVRGNIGYVEGSVMHLWHGNMLHRNSIRRYDGLQEFDFDPFCDIAIAPNGCWQWNTNKSAMHEYVREYLESREEAG